MKRGAFKGVYESYCLPTCSDMIDPYYENGLYSQRIMYQKHATQEELAKYRTMKEHVLAIGQGHEPTDQLFHVFSTLRETVT